MRALAVPAGGGGGVTLVNGGAGVVGVSGQDGSGGVEGGVPQGDREDLALDAGPRGGAGAALEPVAVHAGAAADVPLANRSRRCAVQRGEDMLRPHVEALRVVEVDVLWTLEEQEVPQGALAERQLRAAAI